MGAFQSQVCYIIFCIFYRNLDFRTKFEKNYVLKITRDDLIKHFFNEIQCVRSLKQTGRIIFNATDLRVSNYKFAIADGCHLERNTSDRS